MKVLLLTVGGSDAPIIKTIRYHKPDYVVFFCTEDNGKGSKGSRKGIDGEGLIYQDRSSHTGFGRYKRVRICFRCCHF